MQHYKFTYQSLNNKTVSSYYSGSFDNLLTDFYKTNLWVDKIEISILVPRCTKLFSSRPQWVVIGYMERAIWLER
jgi:hypothetical protein